MKTERAMVEEIALLQKEKGTTCISIIVPTHKLSPDRSNDALQVKKAVQRAKEYVQDHYPSNEAELLTRSIDSLYTQIDFNHNCEGIGLFVSKNVNRDIQFHFPVKEKIIAGNSFELRDWLYEIYYRKSYFLLLLAEKMVKLYQGNLDSLQEIKDHHFPARHIEEYEYNTPSRGSSYTGHAYTKQFERDKPQMEELRYNDFLRKSDHNLGNYLIDHTPLILAGTTESIASFKNLTSQKNIIGEIQGNQFHRPLPELAAGAWQIMKSFLDLEKEKQLKELYEKIEEGKGITGLTVIWHAAQSGRAYKLVVEKDYAQPGFLITGNPYQLHLKPPKEKHEIIPDAVNALMQLVLEKNGEVLVVENGRLENYERIGLVTRY